MEQQEVPTIVIFDDDTWAPMAEVPDPPGEPWCEAEGRPGMTHEDLAKDYFEHFIPGVTPRRRPPNRHYDSSIRTNDR